MTFSETTGRGFIILAGVIALGAILACPKPVPTPVTPDASDAAPVATCAAGCAHAVAVCPTVVDTTCLDLCHRESPAFVAALMAATGCPGVKAADPGAPETQSGTAHPVGR